MHVRTRHFGIHMSTTTPRRRPKAATEALPLLLRFDIGAVVCCGTVELEGDVTVWLVSTLQAFAVDEAKTRTGVVQVARGMQKMKAYMRQEFLKIATNLKCSPALCGGTKVPCSNNASTRVPVSDFRTVGCGLTRLKSLFLRGMP